jgi:CRP/FNR family cyclic AMP-dependent transcriptional regulator
MGRGGKILTPASPEELQMLRRVTWLTDFARDKLATDGRFIRFRAHQSIYLEQTPADRIFFLLAGVARVYYSYKKQRVLVTHLRAGDTFGMSGMVPDAIRRYSSEAVSDCVVLSIAPEIFSEVVFGNSLEQIGPALANTFGRWLDLMTRYAQYVSLGARGRLALSLLELSDKFGVRDARGILLPLPLSHAELGTMVGTSRQHVTTQLREFERDGFIARAGRRLIVNRERLRTALDT